MPGEISVTKLDQLILENEELRHRLNETEETLSAIRNGQVDAIIVSGNDGEKIFSLTSAETPYRLILEQMNEGAVVVSAGGLVLFCNRRFSDIAAIPQEQIIGSGIEGLIEARDHRNFKKLLRSSLSEKTRGTVTFKQKQIHAQLSFVALSRDVDDDICIIVSDITDINNRQVFLQELVDERSAELEELNRQLTSEVEELNRSRQKLKNSARKYAQLLERMTDSEAKYRLLFEKMNEGFALHEIILDKNGEPCDFRYLDANPAFEKLTGYKVSEIKQKRVYEIQPSFKKYLVDEYGKVALTGKTSDIEYYSVSMGKYFNISAFCPQPGQFATIFEDITQRKLTEDELRDSREKLEIALESGHIGIWEWNLNTDRITLDHRMQEIFGLEPDRYSLTAREFENLLHEEDLTHFRKARN
ncbi:MAG: PAS domain S-box protein, partial [Bacteroidales bacterium]